MARRDSRLIELGGRPAGTELMTESKPISLAASAEPADVVGNGIPVVKKRAAPLRSDVVDALRQAIVEGRLAPGTRLTERVLMDLTGVSRTVVREALRQLESELIVETVPNKGPIVRRLTREEAEDIYRIRAVLEGLAAQMFVTKASDRDLATLKDALDRTVAAYERETPETILKIKNSFYSILFQGAGSETLSAMVAALHARISRWRALGLGHPNRSPDRSGESIDGLRRLYAALEARDVDAAEAIAREEVLKAADEIMRIIDFDAGDKG